MVLNMKYDKRKTTTIYDIAIRADVSSATVSKVLNKKGSISIDTQKKIIKIAKELQYTPNPAARSLKTKQTNQIMLSIPSVRDLFFLDMIQIIQSICRKQGYSLLINSTEDGVDEEIKMLANLGNNFIDGLIMVSLDYTKRHFEMIKKINRPVVLCSIGCRVFDEYEMQADFVGVDSKKGIFLATKHLIEQGHTEIGFVGLDVKSQTGNERYFGFIAAMKEYNIEIEEEFIKTGGADEVFGYRVGLEYCKLKKRPTAICVSADQIVIGMYKAFEKEGINVPDDIAIIGMDDIYIADLIKPKLSSVNLSQKEIGKTAVELLLQRLGGEKGSYKSIIYQPKPIWRESSQKL